MLSICRGNAGAKEACNSMNVDECTSQRTEMVRVIDSRGRP